VRIESFKRVIAQTRKELTELLRDRLAIALALLLPLLQLALLGSSFALIVRDLPIIVQNFDDSAASRELIDQFRASLTFRILAWPTDRRPDLAFANGQARGALVIPQDFGKNLAHGMTADVQIIVDGSDANTAKLVSGYASGVVRSFNQAHGSVPVRTGVQTAIRFWYNPSLSSQKFYAPGIFVMALSMFPPLLATLAMAREGELKTILQVYVSNISAHEFVLGKVLAFVVVGLAEASVLLVFLFSFFGIRLAGDPTPFLLATLLYTFCVASFGVMVGAAIPNQGAAMQTVMFGGFLLVFMLSGLMFPLSNVPVSLRWISNLVWARYYIEIVRDAFLQGGGWPAVWWKVLVIAVIGSAFYGMAWRRMRRMQLEV
jgi:drug efflux transport system permease protein